MLDNTFRWEYRSSIDNATVNEMIKNSKQIWEVGQAVKVGFMNLIVLAKVPTPGDYAPDAYALSAVGGGKFYRFVPHNGLVRCDSLAEAMAA